MTIPASTSLNDFQQWIVQSFNSLGLEVTSEVDPLGLEFESDGRIVRVLPHADPEFAVIETEVLSLDRSDELSLARIAILMLRLNDEARFEHQWQVILDVDDCLCISSLVETGATDADQLAELLQEGLERASMLSESIQGLTDLSKRSPEAAPTFDPASLVRG